MGYNYIIVETAEEAYKINELIHNHLVKSVKGYSAERWSEIEKSEQGFAIEVPEGAEDLIKLEYTKKHSEEPMLIPVLDEKVFTGAKLIDRK